MAALKAQAQAENQKQKAAAAQAAAAQAAAQAAQAAQAQAAQVAQAQAAAQAAAKDDSDSDKNMEPVAKASAALQQMGFGLESGAQASAFFLARDVVVCDRRFSGFVWVYTGCRQGRSLSIICLLLETKPAPAGFYTLPADE